MGALYKRAGTRNWMMAVTINGRQCCKTTHTHNRRRASQLLSRWETEVFEGRFQLPRSTPPKFELWADDFLTRVSHPNTRRRYASSITMLKGHFSGLRLSEIVPDLIDQYKDTRLAKGVEPATINHDLRVLRRMMRLAERRQLIVKTPFAAVDFLKQPPPRPPHILTFEEEDRILRVAAPHLRVLVVLILETGMRSHREALALKWDDVDFGDDLIRVRESKTRSGIRTIPLSVRCKAELMHWREMVGPEFSSFVFPNLRKPQKPLTDIRHAWIQALKDAGLAKFVFYNLRHTHASRLTAAGVSSLFVAQMLGHSGPAIVGTYARSTDEYKRDAIRKLEQMRGSYAQTGSITSLKALELPSVDPSHSRTRRTHM